MNATPRSVFAQLVLIIGLVLLGSGVLALVLGRELAVRPAAEQLLKAMDAFADVAEELARTQSTSRAMQLLRESGLEVSEARPVEQALRAAPLMRELREQARPWSARGRELLLGRSDGVPSVWLKLDTRPALWVSFALERRGQGARRFSMALLIGSALLAWLAAAWFARRLVMPLRRLAEAAPAIVRGEPLDAAARGGPREVAELADALDRSAQEVRLSAEERALMLAGISHDLRTPLTRVRFALELLPGTDPQLRAGMERDVDEIDAILSQFIAYARDGRDEASEDVDLVAVCRNAVDAAPGSWRLHAPANATITGKPMALLRAVENLLVNAQRHGLPPFSLQLSREHDAWCIEVCDQGSGLPQRDGERMRQPFVHGENGGSGLGLAIVERVARQHRGELVLAPNTPSGLCARLLLRGV